jgi:hypothetical protein
VFDGLPLGKLEVAEAVARLSLDRLRAVIDVLATVTVMPIGKGWSRVQTRTSAGEVEMTSAEPDHVIEAICNEPRHARSKAAMIAPFGRFTLPNGEVRWLIRDVAGGEPRWNCTGRPAAGYTVPLVPVGSLSWSLP